MKKNIGTILVLFTLVLPIVFAADVFIEADSENSPMTIDNIYVLEDNYYHRGDYIIGDDFIDDVIVALDSAGNDLYHTHQGFSLTILPADDRIAEIAIYKEDVYNTMGASAEPLASRAVNLCNHNGICEPCGTDDCTDIENFASCPSDCASGSFDGFCDMEPDGFCDPDCNGEEADCPGCEPFCLYDDSDCDMLGGAHCSEGQDCIGGYFVANLWDGPDRDMLCCVAGECGDEMEYAATQELIDLHPEEMDVVEADIWYNYSGPSCSEQGGMICDWHESCTGEWTSTLSEQDDGPCCLGKCYESEEFLVGEDTSGISGEVTLTDELAAPFEPEPVKAERRELPPGTEDKLSQEELMMIENGDLLVSSDGNFTVSKDSEIDPDVNAADMIFVDEKYDAFVEQSELAEEEDEIYDDNVEEMAFDEKVLGFSPLSYIIVLAGVLIIIAGSVIAFRMQRSPPAPASTPVQQNVGLQDEIEELLAKKMNYTQIRNALTAKGHDLQTVNKEIAKNYYDKKRLMMKRQQGQ